MSIAHLLARVKNLEIVSSTLVESLLSGNYRSVFRGPGLEFSEVREYVEGDDTRLVDWNVSSRMGSVYTKTFREERELALFLLVDLSASINTSRGGSRIREAASLVFSLMALAGMSNNDRVGACFFTDRIEAWVPPRKGKKHVLSLIQDAVGLEPKGTGSDIDLAVRTTGEALKRRGMVVVISDFKSRGYMRNLSILARRHDVVAVRLVPPEDLAFPRIGMVHMEDAESGRVIRGFGNSHAFRKAWRDWWLTHRRAWFRDCHRHHIAPLEIRADEDPVAKLVHFFQHRKAGR